MDLWMTELRDDGVFVAAYDNPPMNYFTAQATAELRELLARWRDPDVKAVVITGAPSGKFITHYSVEELVHRSAHPEQLRRSFPVHSRPPRCSTSTSSSIRARRAPGACGRSVELVTGRPSPRVRGCAGDFPVIEKGAAR